MVSVESSVDAPRCVNDERGSLPGAFGGPPLTTVCVTRLVMFATGCDAPAPLGLIDRPERADAEAVAAREDAEYEEAE